MSGSLPTAQRLRHQAYRRAYEADLWKGSGPKIPQDALAAADFGELWDWFRAAWSLRDMGETVRIGEALQAKGGMQPTDLVRLRSALVVLGRADEAAAMGPESDSAPQDLLALAAAGRLPEARRRLAEVDALIDPRAMALLDCALDEVARPDTAWDPAAGPIAAALQLGFGDLAADLAAEALGPGAPPAEQLGPALELLQASIRLGSGAI